MLPVKLINVLIRTSFRPELFKRCIDSVRRQDHPNIRIIVGYDREDAYIPDGVEKVALKPCAGRFFYNLYCNQLKDLVTEGWFFFLDDDDYLFHYKALSCLADKLEDGATIVQFIRGSKRKPKDELMNKKEIVVGHIGLPCLILSANYKNVADLDGEKDFGDYTWIKKVTENVKTKFVKEPLVVAERRSWGRIYLK